MKENLQRLASPMALVGGLVIAALGPLALIGGKGMGPYGGALTLLFGGLVVVAGRNSRNALVLLATIGACVLPALTAYDGLTSLAVSGGDWAHYWTFHAEHWVEIAAVTMACCSAALRFLPGPAHD